MTGTRPTRILPAVAASLLATGLAATLLVSCASSGENPRPASTYSVDPGTQAEPSARAGVDARPHKVTTHPLAHYKRSEPYTIRHPFPQAGITHTYGLRPTVFTQLSVRRAVSLTAVQERIRLHSRSG